MNTRKKKRTRNRKCRKGAAVVEAALIIPMVIVVTFGSIDIAQYINLAQVVSNSSREAARVASQYDTTTVEEVESSVRAYVAATFPNMSTQEVENVVNIEVRDKDNEIVQSDLTVVSSGDPVSVQVTFDYSQIRWIPGPDYFGGNSNVSLTTSRRE